MKKTKENSGITLIALIVTIIILLILAGVAISNLGGENSLIAKVQKAKKAHIEAEIKEQLILALQELQIAKEGNATLDDVTQEWANDILNDYEPTITSDASISGKKVTMAKSEIIGKYIIDEKLNVTEIEQNDSSIELTYQVKSREGENLQVSVIVTDKENGLEKIEYNDGHIQETNGEKEVSRNCTIQLGVEYKVKITSKSGQEKTETILINDYYYKITKNLDEGINIDNPAVKAAYNKPYQAIITTKEGCLIDKITVTMGDQTVTINEITGEINIEKVTEDIVITAKILTIPEANIYVSTKGNDTTGDGSQENPYASLSTAINNAVTGDKIYIFPGEYNLTNMDYWSYGDTGIYDQGKQLEIWGANEKTILKYDGDSCTKRDAYAVVLRNKSIIRNLIYNFVPKTSTNDWSNAIFAQSVEGSKICNVFFEITGENTASYYYQTSNTSDFKNCTFYHELEEWRASYGTVGQYIDCATNRPCWNIITTSDSFGKNTDEYGIVNKISNLSELVKDSREDEIFNTNEVGVYFGEYAWD